MDKTLNLAFDIAKKIQADVPKHYTPPCTGGDAKTQLVFPLSIVQGTRTYIERVAHQINGSYGEGWYDACLVMLRRLFETLIIECFEAHNISTKIQDKNGDYFMLDGLVDCALSESCWHLGRDSKRTLKRFKDICNNSAHNRRFVAHKYDIDNVSNDIRITVQELVYISKLKI